MNVKLIRNTESYKGTYGTIIKDDVPLCVTLELPWRDNSKNVSCIPMGTYKVKKYNSPKYPDVWELQNVEDRTYILIHAGNFLHDTNGCILVGTSFGNGCINSSKKALNKLRSALPDEFTLEVHNALF